MSNLPIEMKNENRFKKFFKSLKNIFKKESKDKSEIIEESDYFERKSKKIIESYRIDNLDEINFTMNKNNIKMQEIIDIIEKNPSMLEKLDLKRLEIIDDYYKEKIEEYKRLLNKIQNN